MPQIEWRTCELNPQLCVGHGNLSLFPSEVEVVVDERLLRHIKDHNLSLTKVNDQLSVVTDTG
jgi:hypothetical protein